MIKIKGYKIIEKLDTQGPVVNYIAKQESLDRNVILRILEPKLSNIGEVKDFVKEAREAAQLKHNNVVEVYDIGEYDGIFYMALEFLEGKTIRDIVESEGPIPWKRALNICRIVAEVLDNAWNKYSMTHKCISPDSIIYTKEGFVKVTGFGKPNPSDPVILEAYLKADILKGTMQFFPPEILDKEELTFKSDMYSLGSTLYFMVTGVIPFSDNLYIDALEKHKNEKLTNPRELNKRIPPSVAQIIIKLMMKDPSERYMEWKNVIEDINTALSGRFVKIKPGWEHNSTIAPISKIVGTTSSPKSAILKKKKKIPPPSWMRIIAWPTIIISWSLTFYILYHKEINSFLGISR